jgi:cytochrome c peroxidase
VNFYHKGGGVGLGIDLPFQSLPFDSLQLNESEKRSIVTFMNALTDRIDN